jgi:hypothetical protein
MSMWNGVFGPSLFGEKRPLAEMFDERRQWLGQHAPKCPKCKRGRVELLDFFKPAQWQCQAAPCRHRFTHEPA